MHCRRAVQYALDKQAVKDALGGTYAASLATTLWPRVLPGYPATAPYPTGEGNRGDLAKAKQELAQCGKPGGFSTALGTVDDGRGKVAADVVVRSLARVGIVATEKQYPGARSWPRSPAPGRGPGRRARPDRRGVGRRLPLAARVPGPAGGRAQRAALGQPQRGRAVRGRGGDRRGQPPTLDPVQAIGAWRQVAATAMTTAGYAPLVEDRAVLLGSARLRNAYVQPVYRGYDLRVVGVE